MRYVNAMAKHLGGTKPFGGGNSNIFYFHPILGEDEPNLTHIFSDGLVQPPTRNLSEKKTRQKTAQHETFY